MRRIIVLMILVISIVEYGFSSGLVTENEKQLGSNCYKLGKRISIIIDSHREDINNIDSVYYYPKFDTSIFVKKNKLLIFNSNKISEKKLNPKNTVNDLEYYNGKIYICTNAGLYLDNKKIIRNMPVLSIIIYNDQIYIATPGKVFMSQIDNFQFREISKHRISGVLIVNSFKIMNNSLVGVEDEKHKYIIVGGIISPIKYSKIRTVTKSKVRKNKNSLILSDIKTFPGYWDNKKRINLLNFLNGMTLKKEQYQKLIVLAQKCINTKKVYGKKIDKLKKRAAKILGEMYVKMMKGYKLDEAFLEKVSTISGAVDPVKHELNGKICDLEQQVIDVFTPIEKQLVKDFVPCVVPPLGLSDPIRIGQAGYSYKDKVLLDKIRNMSEIEYFKKKDELINFVLQEAENEFGLIGKKTRDYLVVKISKVFDDARNLNQIDYEIQREKMAVQINKENLEAYLKNKRENLHREVERAPGKIAFLFLSDFSVEIYKFRLSQLEKKEL